MAVQLVVKITGGPTLFDATITDSTVDASMKFVSGTAYPDEHPMFEHGNSAVYSQGFKDGTNDVGDVSNILPIGYAWSAHVPTYKIQEAIEVDPTQAIPVAPVEDQFDSGGPFDEGGANS